ncbi:golgin subfamily A member 1 isoform X2 [Galleria mellonella]|uniref:Golgin subfamily A member 1 isoform X2 n=1 Tax=Galleria mellonella TaxID=7137 RepID=A0A6J1WWG3_GALME|nr:golgin subfamily A member 1 isoform X2 [Galleria mellonella]
MFASLKSKIKEETGSDISKLTSSWRNGSFLGRITLKDDSSTASPSSSGGPGDSTSDSLSPQLESYISDRTGGQLDQAALNQQYSAQLELKLKDRDAYWEKKIEELKLSQASVQAEEAVAAQAVARAAQAEAAKAISDRDAAVRQVDELRERLAAVEHAQDRLDALTEELEQSRRTWSQLAAARGAAEERARDLEDQITVLRAALPPDNEQHHMHHEDKRAVEATGCADYDRVCRERAVLTRQLQEAKMALADVKTSWSGQIASLETQVARLSRQAGEEGAERRRVETEKREMQEKLMNLATELEKTKQNLVNSEAKEKTMGLESRIEELVEENKELSVALENERMLVRILKEKVDKSNRLYDEQKAEVNHLNSILTDMQHDYVDMQRKYEKEKREKDEALLRNAHMSQSVEMSQCNVRYQESEIGELKAKIVELEALLAQHKENQAECMLIKQNEESRLAELEQLKKRIDEFTESENTFKKTIQDLETEICDKNKKIKTLDNRISDMKKTLQRELQSSKSDLTSAEEQDISRKYLKHVVLRFLTARELEARQLTRALAALLRLSAHEEALLRATLQPRSGLAAWFPSLSSLSTIPSLPSLNT